MTQEREPLWQVMADAYAKATDSNIRDSALIACGNAAEIRALRDWLVPEESDPSPEGTQADSFAIADWYRWHERQRLRALLTAEAERAERGDA